MKLCSIEGCGRPHQARGWCNKHYRRWLNHDDPNKVLRIVHSGTNRERFWAKVDCRTPNECWEWQAARRRGGYGVFKLAGHLQTAHRVSWILNVGPIPPGKLIVHLCNNPPCVNPAHLRVATQKQNLMYAVRLGRR